MCTAVISVDLDSPVPVLLVGVRDEFAVRSWRPPGRHWPDRPTLVGGIDLRAGGTWLAVDPDAPRAACVLNGRGRDAPEEGRLSRGGLPLLAAAGHGPAGLELDRFDPFHLIRAEPGEVLLWSWDGRALDERALGPGLHLVVNSGLEGAGQSAADRPEEERAVAHMAARVAHFRPRLRAAARPEPAPGPEPAATAWGEWLPLVNGDGLPPDDPRAMILRRELDGRLWGTSSISLVALSAAGARYDFSAAPGDPAAWTAVR